MTCSFLTFLGPFISLWTSSGAAISLLGSSGSSGACLGEFSSPLHSNHSLTRSDAVLGFFNQFPASSTLHDAPNTSVLAPVSSFLELVTLSPPRARPLRVYQVVARVYRVVEVALGDALVRRHRLFHCADCFPQPLLTIVHAPISPLRSCHLNVSSTSQPRPGCLGSPL